MWESKSFRSWLLPTDSNQAGKRETAAPKEGQGVADKKQVSHCAYCGKMSYSNETFQMCSSWFSVKYCSKLCQRLHWNKHKTLCLSIKELLRQNSVSPAQSVDESSFVSQLTPKQTSKIAKLVGKRCLILVHRFQLFHSVG